MGNLIVSFLCDGGLAVLLVATIAYCAKLSRRIRLLQDSRSELAEMIARFDHATERATASVTELQSLSKRITDALQLKIEKANFLADDLAFLIEKSTKLAQQLESVKKPRAEPIAEKPKSASVPKPFFETLLPHPRSVAGPSPAMEPSSPVASSRARVASSLEAVLQRLASSAAATEAPMPSAAGNEATQVPRTEAERELIEALKSGR